MPIFLSAFEDIPDPRASNARHDLGELLAIAFVAALCGSASCAEMAAFGRAKESFFRGFLKLKHAIPSHDTFSGVFRMIDPKALDAAFGKVLADIAALLREGDVIAIHGKALRGARDKGESARTRMMVSAYASRLRLTLATATADHGTELEAALQVLGLIALKGKIVTADAVRIAIAANLSEKAGPLHFRSAKMAHATVRITAPAISPSCVAGLSTSSAGTRQRGPSPSSSSVPVGTTLFYEAFSMA